MSERSTSAFVGLGSNLGDRAGHLEAALREMAALPATTLVARSALYETAPFEADGGDYLNAVAHLRTALDAPALLRELQAIEAAHGRERSYTNAPRTLDLDLLLHGDTRHAAPDLSLPHPRLHERAFVLLPLAEIAPGLRVPGRGRVDDLLRVIGTQRVARWAKP